MLQSYCDHPKVDSFPITAIYSFNLSQQFFDHKTNMLQQPLCFSSTLELLMLLKDNITEIVTDRF